MGSCRRKRTRRTPQRESCRKRCAASDDYIPRDPCCEFLWRSLLFILAVHQVRGKSQRALDVLHAKTDGEHWRKQALQLEKQLVRAKQVWL